MKRTERAKGGQPYQKSTGNTSEPVDAPTLAELGLKKRESRTQGGELIAEKIEHGGDRKTESRSHDATLKNMGINKTQSSRWQASVILAFRIL